MSIGAMCAVWNRYPEGGGELLLALAIADAANGNGEVFIPRISELAAKTRQSEPVVLNGLLRMSAAGWLECVDEVRGAWRLNTCGARVTLAITERV